MERFAPEEIRFILDEIILNLKELRTDVYGNYVISHMLEFGSFSDRDKIIDEIIDDLPELSLHKFGSNVVEKCLVHSSPER
jgi:Pumilio-family RNA binding repeat